VVPLPFEFQTDSELRRHLPLLQSWHRHHSPSVHPQRQILPAPPLTDDVVRVDSVISAVFVNWTRSDNLAPSRQKPRERRSCPSSS
jgi:hypothetical protein